MASFKTKEHEYFWTNKLPVDRYIELQKLQPEVAVGLTWQNTYNELAETWLLMEQSKNASAAVKIRNILDTGKRSVDLKENASLLLITLFCNRKGDEKELWDKERAQDYIQDWHDSMIDTRDFLALAFKMVETSELGLEASSESTLKATPAKRKKAPTKKKKKNI